jgi:hypothetical protein
MHLQLSEPYGLQLAQQIVDLDGLVLLPPLPFQFGAQPVSQGTRPVNPSSTVE